MKRKIVGSMAISRDGGLCFLAGSGRVPCSGTIAARPRPAVASLAPLYRSDAKQAR